MPVSFYSHTFLGYFFCIPLSTAFSIIRSFTKETFVVNKSWSTISPILPFCPDLFILLSSCLKNIFWLVCPCPFFRRVHRRWVFSSAWLWLCFYIFHTALGFFLACGCVISMVFWFDGIPILPLGQFINLNSVLHNPELLVIDTGDINILAYRLESHNQEEEEEDNPGL